MMRSSLKLAFWNCSIDIAGEYEATVRQQLGDVEQDLKAFVRLHRAVELVQKEKTIDEYIVT